MKIEKTVRIQITQADVEQAVRNLIAEQDATLLVEEIKFIPKRNGPDKIAVEVNASFGNVTTIAEPEPEPEVSVVDILQNNDDLPEPEPEPVVEEEKKSPRSPDELMAQLGMRPAKSPKSVVTPKTETKAEVKSKLFQ